MGGLTPVLGVLGSFGGSLGTVATTIGTVVAAADTLRDLSGEDAQDKALRQQRELQIQQERQIREANDLKREENALSDAADQERRQRALRSAVARQRASFGASGIAQSDGGSAQAVLLGLYNESDAEQAQQDSLNALRDRSLQLSEAQLAQRNLLSLTQSQENQQLTSIINEV